MRFFNSMLMILIALSLSQAAFAHTGLDYPNGGEVFSPGDEVSIRWHIYIGHVLENWDLWYAVDAPDPSSTCSDQFGPDWIPIAMDIPATCTNGSGSCESAEGGCSMEYVWMVPEGTESDAVKIRVRMDNAGNDYYDVSNNPFTIQGPTAVDESPAEAGLRFEGSHPNPFNPKTSIRYALAEAGRVNLGIYDVGGNRIATLLDEVQAAGSHSIAWEGRDDSGRPAASGIYFAVVESGGKLVTGKLTLIK